MTTVQVRETTVLPADLELSPGKRRLFEVAVEMFGQQGYHAVSIRDLASELGVQPGAIYFHVASKQDLLFELAKIGHDAHLSGLKEGLMGAGADPHDQLAAITRAHIEMHMDFPSMARLTNREMRALTPEQHDEVMAIRVQAEQVTLDVIERGVRLGAFTSADPFLDGKCIGAMGVRLPEWWTPESPRGRDEIIEHYVTAALRLVS